MSSSRQIENSAWSKDPLLPLSKRSVGELRAKANELREMAKTATTADVEDALLRLADRFASLADSREFDLAQHEPTPQAPQQFRPTEC